MNSLIQEVLLSDGWARVIKPALDQHLFMSHNTVHLTIRAKKTNLEDVKYSQGFADGVQSVISLIERLRDS